MTAIKLDSKLPATVPDSLADAMWEGLGGHYWAIVELRVSERTEPDTDDVERSAKLRVQAIEVLTDREQAKQAVGILRAAWKARTAAGTLDEVADPETGEIARGGAK
jgi:hypothetical protein